jgi:hypothetical protein
MSFSRLHRLHHFHANRKPLPHIVKFRPENPSLLTIIEEAQTSSATFIADFGDYRLPTIHNAFECLSKDKPHFSSSYRLGTIQFATAQQHEQF